MSKLSVGFIRASIFYLLFGITLGLTMALPGGYTWMATTGQGQPNIAHAHSNLLGFMLMMVMGVAYHIFPRFTGNPIRRPKVAWVNFWCCQVGTIGMISGFLVRGLVPWLVPAAAIIQVVGIVCFAVNVLQVVKPLKRISL
jgi:cbb3-type cytochrome oxidase subunit 1